MNGYVKKIAVIKGLKGGFSADGGALSGLVKAETYAGFFKAEVSLINFAPLSEGRFLFGITDGLKSVTFEGTEYEGEEDIDIADGFAFLACFCHGGVYPVASAVSGTLACALPDLKEYMTKTENARPAAEAGVSYDDEAVSEVNYYEYEARTDGGAVRESEKKEKDGHDGGEDEARARPVGSEEGAHGSFYARAKDGIEKIFSSYPREKSLEEAVDGSRWARIPYGGGNFYVFGVIKKNGSARYICYGVPAKNGDVPPESLKGAASYLPVGNGGYWVMYQDAKTGVTITK